MKLGKRGKGKYKADYKAKDLYKFYKGVTEKDLQLDNGKFHDILLQLNKGLSEIVLNGDQLFLPCGLGSKRINKTKIDVLNKKSLRIDWGTSRKVGKIVYFLNEKRKGAIYKIKWFKGTRVNNIKGYSFEASRPFKRGVKPKLEDLSFDYLAQS